MVGFVGSGGGGPEAEVVCGGEQVAGDVSGGGGRVDVDGGRADAECSGSVGVFGGVGWMGWRGMSSSDVSIGGGDGEAEACIGRGAGAGIGSGSDLGAGEAVRCERLEHAGVGSTGRASRVGGDVRWRGPVFWGCVEWVA